MKRGGKLLSGSGEDSRASSSAAFALLGLRGGEGSVGRVLSESPLFCSPLFDGFKLGLRQLFFVYCFGMLVSCFAVFYLMFFRAYVSGVVYDVFESVLVINVFGEAHLEAVLLLLALPGVVYFLLRARDEVVLG